MIERNDLYHIPFYKKSDFTGSYQGMRYRIGKIAAQQKDGETNGPEFLLKASVWPGPLSSDATPEEKKESETFAFSNDGITAACDWLNQKYSEKEELYRSCHI